MIEETKAISQTQNFKNLDENAYFDPKGAEPSNLEDSQNPQNFTDLPAEHDVISPSQAGAAESENSMKTNSEHLPIGGMQSNNIILAVSPTEEYSVKIPEKGAVSKIPESPILLGSAANVRYEGAAPSSRTKLFDCDSVFVWSLIYFVLIPV
ncbi:hypothetical protein OXX79_003347 [Metschnikowia pulcherrima]